VYLCAGRHDTLFVVGSLNEIVMLWSMRYHSIDIETSVLRSHRKICEWYVFDWQNVWLVGSGVIVTKIFLISLTDLMELRHLSKEIENIYLELHKESSQYCIPALFFTWTKCYTFTVIPLIMNGYTISDALLMWTNYNPITLIPFFNDSYAISSAMFT